jgi:predicted anti-sigma-YlaC factor YlaD
MGAIHEMMITLESLPESMGGSPDRARQHFERAIALSSGNAAGPYLSYAIGVLGPLQDREQFVGMLNEAMAIDPDKEPGLRLANIITQQYARYLLDHLDDVFLSEPQGGAS